MSTYNSNKDIKFEEHSEDADDEINCQFQFYYSLINKMSML